jgi:hypothetical protein
LARAASLTDICHFVPYGNTCCICRTDVHDEYCAARTTVSAITGNTSPGRISTGATIAARHVYSRRYTRAKHVLEVKEHVTAPAPAPATPATSVISTRHATGTTITAHGLDNIGVGVSAAIYHTSR